ncbi:MAG: hypothetical protein RL059_1057 [Bacteroidota bacterium]|jgi:hypothetical protein
MIDWVSCSVPFMDIRNLRDRLDFKSEHCVKTGELKTSMGGYIVERAMWNGLKFEIHNKIGSSHFAMVKFSGSIHKFSNGANFDNFYKCQLKKCIQEISFLIGVSPHLIEVHAIEFGVNIHTHVSPSLILDRLIFFKQVAFERQTKFKGGKRGFIQRCTRSNYELKAYNKSLDYNLNENILRFEIKVTKMQFFKNKISGIHCLNDLLDDKILHQLGSLLQQIWNHVVLKEDVFNINPNLSVSQKVILSNTASDDYWKRIQKEYKPYKFNRLISRYQNAIKGSKTTEYHEEIRNKIQTKWHQLSSSVNYLPISKIHTVNYLPLCMV